jgi:hypothetical protein
MKSLLTIVSCSVLLFLAWCGQEKPVTFIEQPVQEIVSTWAIKATGVAICDNYLSSIQCIANYATGTDKVNFNASYESLLQSFQDVPGEQLVKTCTTLSDALRTHPTLLQDYPSCNTL